MAIINTIIFDYGDVLARDNINLFEKHFGYGKLSAANRSRYEDTVKQCELGKIGTSELFSVMHEILAPQLTAQEIRHWLLGHSKSLPTLKLARKLKEKGYRILILSNNFRGWNKAMENAGKYSTRGIPFINSAVIGKRKQDGAMFRYAIRRFALNPKNCIFIDDHTYNTVPAKLLGFHTIHFRQDDSKLKTQLRKFGVRI